MINWFGYYKALHLIFMVSWFAGLFYMVRLFVYYAESDQKHKDLSGPFKTQYLLMQKRLWFIISWPAMILTLIFGILMLIDNPSYLKIPWMHVKLAFVALLVVYHLLCHFIYLRQKNRISNFTSIQMRIWNEVATLFLVAIIFVVSLKNELDGFYGIIGFITFGITLFLAVNLYRKFRKS